MITTQTILVNHSWRYPGLIRYFASGHPSALTENAQDFKRMTSVLLRAELLASSSSSTLKDHSITAFHAGPMMLARVAAELVQELTGWKETAPLFAAISAEQ